MNGGHRIANNRLTRGAGERRAALAGTASDADGQPEHRPVMPDYVRLAYERIERTDELLARIEHVLVTARRGLE